MFVASKNWTEGFKDLLEKWLTFNTPFRQQCMFLILSIP
jgi:hypothetical protein